MIQLLVFQLLFPSSLVPTESGSCIWTRNICTNIQLCTLNPVEIDMRVMSPNSQDIIQTSQHSSGCQKYSISKALTHLEQ